LLASDPSLSLDALDTLLRDHEIFVSRLTLSNIRRSFLSDLRFLQAEGVLSSWSEKQGKAVRQLEPEAVNLGKPMSEYCVRKYPIRVSEEEIEAGKSRRGGWTRDTLACWDVPWPPPKGWKKALIKGQPIPKRKEADGLITRAKKAGWM
jgi:hypothetical protein